MESCWNHCGAASQTTNLQTVPVPERGKYAHLGNMDWRLLMCLPVLYQNQTADRPAWSDSSITQSFIILNPRSYLRKQIEGIKFIIDD